MRSNVVIDFETRSAVDIRSAGAVRYAEDPSTEALCLAYKIDDEPTQIWISDVPFGADDTDCPADLRTAVQGGATIEAHGALFESSVWHHIMVDRYGWPAIDASQWRDTMAVCAHRALPLSLDDVGVALGLKTQKDKRGKYLINTLSKRKKATKNLPERYNEDFGLYQEFYDYCVQDVDSEYELGQVIGELPGTEYDIWRLDQTINQRGVRIDKHAVNNAITVVNDAREYLTAELFSLTDGMVASGNQVAMMLQWLEIHGVQLLDLKAETVTEELKNDEYSTSIVRLLELRQTLSKNSTAKLQRMLDCACGDSRARGLLQYAGAHRTGRWAGRLIQPQNFPRGSIDADMDTLIRCINCGDWETVDLMYGDAMAAVATSLRGMIVSEYGYRLLVADFAQIEGRVLAVIAGQRDLIASFAKGEDVYAVLATKIYGRPINKHDNPRERFVGKEAVLGLGYQMGKDRFFNELKDKGAPQSLEFCKNVVDIYRTEYSGIKQLWYAVEGQAINAVANPGKIFQYGDIKFRYVSNNLEIKIPSGRTLYYYKPKLHETTTPWGAATLKLSYMGYNNKSGGRVWGRMSTYGGMLVENIVQAIARDIMAEAMLRVEAAGYRMVLTVHDEIIAEMRDGEGSLDEFIVLMEIPPPWAIGYPIKAEGWEGNRYRK